MLVTVDKSVPDNWSLWTMPVLAACHCGQCHVPDMLVTVDNAMCLTCWSLLDNAMCLTCVVHVDMGGPNNLVHRLDQMPGLGLALVPPVWEPKGPSGPGTMAFGFKPFGNPKPPSVAHSKALGVPTGFGKPKAQMGFETRPLGFQTVWEPRKKGPVCLAFGPRGLNQGLSGPRGQAPLVSSGFGTKRPQMAPWVLALGSQGVYRTKAPGALSQPLVPTL